jgi:hypothetical protein
MIWATATLRLIHRTLLLELLLGEVKADTRDPTRSGNMLDPICLCQPGRDSESVWCGNTGRAQGLYNL